jgi:hypothetical protein
MPTAKKKFFKRTIVKVFIMFALVFMAMIVYFAIVAIDHPPDVREQMGNKPTRKSIGNNAYTYGNNWIRRNDSGLWEVYIEGKPFERGIAFGELTRELLYFQETAFVEQIRELVPSDNYLKVLKYFIAFFNRNLDQHVAKEYKEEIFGTSLASSPEYDFIGSGYQRQLNYHAAHDIGHALQGMNLVACTSFSVWDSKSKDSSLLLGRNFDFYMGEKFAENKIVCFVNPFEGYRFAMVTWPDLIGVVSGMNEKGLTVTLNAAKSAVPSKSATPVTLLAREILQYATTIAEAFEIAKKCELFVSESIMIGSARDHKTAIIEKSPEKTGLFEVNADHIISTNHFQGEIFAKDETNIENIRDSDSQKRFERANELIERYNKLGTAEVAGVLRDRYTLGDIHAGMGNQLSINLLIAHHSVIFQPDSLLIWVSASPWQLGKYIAYNLNDVFKLKASDIESGREIYVQKHIIPEDSFLQTSEYASYLQYLKMSRQLKEITSEAAALPDTFIAGYIRSNPELYLTYARLGDYFYAIKAFDKAHTYYTIALTKTLPGLNEKERLTQLANKSHKKNEQ